MGQPTHLTLTDRHLAERLGNPCWEGCVFGIVAMRMTEMEVAEEGPKKCDDVSSRREGE
jgi:hypothetical protein